MATMKGGVEDAAVCARLCGDGQAAQRDARAPWVVLAEIRLQRAGGREAGSVEAGLQVRVRVWVLFWRG